MVDIEQSFGEGEEMAKSKYETQVEPKLLLIEAWARDGLSEKQIARNLGIADSTFRAYKGRYGALSAALARGKEVVDVIVENALLKKCTGYDYTETTQEFKMVEAEGGTPERVLVKEKTVTRHVPGDVTAQMFWLANRKKPTWKYKPEDTGAAEDGGGVIFLAPVDEGLEGGGENA